MSSYAAVRRQLADQADPAQALGYVCTGCQAPTTYADMSTYGARCRGCYEAFRRAAFNGRRCFGDKAAKERMTPRQYAAHRLDLARRSGVELSSVQTAFLAALQPQLGG